MTKNQIAVSFVLVSGVTLAVAFGSISGRQGSDTVLSGDSMVQDKYGLPRYFDALFGYENVPKMPIRNIFASRDKADKATMGIVTERPLVAPLVKPVAVHKPVVSEAAMPRLIGIVIRDHESRAFFADDKFYTVSKGDTVAGRYRITAIQPEKVQVFDKSTGSRRTININN